MIQYRRCEYKDDDGEWSPAIFHQWCMLPLPGDGLEDPHAIIEIGGAVEVMRYLDLRFPSPPEGMEEARDLSFAEIIDTIEAEAVAAGGLSDDAQFAIWGAAEHEPGVASSVLAALKVYHRHVFGA